MASLGEASINVRADLKPFTKDLAKDLGIILNAAEKEVQRRGKDIGKKLSDSIRNGAKANASKIGPTISREIAKTKITIKTEVDEKGALSSARRTFSGIGSLARGAATSITKRFADTFVSLGRFLQGTIGSAFSSIGGGGRGGGAGMAALAAGIGVLISLLASLIPFALQATQAIGGLVAALALVPAAGAAVAGVMTVLNLAFQGFDKAISAALEGDMDAFNKALEDLTPAARTAARAMQPFLTMIQDVVQQAFFREITGGVRALFKALAGSEIPRSLELIAGQLGSIVDDFLRWLASAEGIELIETVFRAISESLNIMQPALIPFVRAIGVLIRAGSSILPSVAKVLANLATSFAKFIDDADRSGALAMFFTNLQTLFEKLGPVVGELFGLLIRFLNWAVSNPDAIVGIANAFFTFADALAAAFSDPVVVSNMKIILEIFASIPPESWIALAIAITQAATALGVLGAAMIYLGTAINAFLVKIRDWFNDLLGITDRLKSGLEKRAIGFRNAGAGLMKSFFEGIKNAAGGAINVADAIVSRIKSGINTAIRAVNSRLDSAFSIFNVDFPDIPFLAKGGILDSPTLAMVAEKGPEAVIPLNNPARAAAIMMQSGLMNLAAPIVNVFLGTEQLEQRMYQVVAKNNATQATNLRHGPRTV